MKQALSASSRPGLDAGGEIGQRHEMPPLSIVSVVFELELELLGLQARSLARFAGADVVAELVVIDNSARPMPRARRDELLTQYGALRDKVVILRPEDICRVPAARGWTSQQVLKLAVADRVRSDRYVVLDAKNHFTRSVRPELFVAADGRPRARVYSYLSHPLRPTLERVLRYVGLDPAEHLERFTATVTPFVLPTELVRSMMRDVEVTSGRPFADEFVAQELAEFFLCSAWALSRGRRLDEVYALNEDSYPAVWPSTATEEGVQQAIASAARSGSPVFSVHRTALARLDERARALLAAHWVDCGLLDSSAEAQQLIARHERQMKRGATARRAREVARAVRSTVRRRAGRRPEVA